MKKLITIFVSFFYSFMLSVSCTSNDAKLQSVKNVEIAEELIRTNLSLTPDLNDTSRKAFLKALDHLNNAIELDSLNGRAYHDKLAVLMDLGKGIDLMTLSKLLKIEPGWADGYTQLGFIYEKTKKFDSAKRAYENARSIYLIKPPSDLRNLNLFVLEFLITNNKNNTFAKLKEFPIQNPGLVKTARDQIDEIERKRMIER